jgi:hypothetical protein
MKERDRVQEIVKVAKAYMDESLFTSSDNKHMVGWKLYLTTRSAHILITVGWALVDFLLEDKYKAGVYAEALKSAGVPEAEMDINKYLQVLAYYNNASAMERTENFKQAVLESDRYIIMPGNYYIDTRAIKPLREFLDDVVEYRLVRTVQMVYKLQDGWVHLHISPLSPNTKKEGAVKVNPYNVDTEHCDGLFF